MTTMNRETLHTAIVTDRLKSYGSALAELGLSSIHHDGKSARTTELKIPTYPFESERQQLGFKSQASAQRFLTSHAAVYNTFYAARHLTTRPTLRTFRAAAFEAWSRATYA